MAVIPADAYDTFRGVTLPTLEAQMGSKSRKRIATLCLALLAALIAAATIGGVAAPDPQASPAAPPVLPKMVPPGEEER